MYGQDGPGTLAQQLAAQIRTLNNLMARFPHLETSAATLSMRNLIDQKMARLSSQERARIKAGQMKGSPKLPKWSDRTLAALQLLHRARAGPVNLSRFQRDLKSYIICEPLPDGSARHNKAGYTERKLSLDLRTLRTMARVMGVPVRGRGRPGKPAT
jgi:hypothetical protein